MLRCLSMSVPKRKQTSTSFLLSCPPPFLMQLPCGPGAKGGFSLPRNSWIKQWGKGVLRDQCSQHRMDQDIHMVTTNIINLLIVALPPENKLLPLASLTHPWLGHPSQQNLQISLTAKPPDFKVLARSHDNHFVRTIISSQESGCSHHIPAHIKLTSKMKSEPNYQE